jgi:acetate kinase
VREHILVINAGSSSTKFSVFETKPDRSLSPLAHGQVDGIGEHTGTSPRLEVVGVDGGPSIDEPIAGNDDNSAMTAICRWLVAHVGSVSALAGVGHRVVHGGFHNAAPVLIDDTIMVAPGARAARAAASAA